MRFNGLMHAEHLNSFCVVARRGSVSGAARELGLTQPAISRHLRLLQEARGAPLYLRRGQGISLTPAGRELLPYACAVRQALLQAHEVLEGRVSRDWTRLSIGLSHHLTTRFTTPLLRGAKACNDEGYQLQLHLREGYTSELIQGLQAGSIDAAWTLGVPAGTEGLNATEVGSEQVVLLVRDDDPLARYNTLPVTALEGETLVVPSYAAIVYRQMTDALDEAGVRPGRVLEVSGPAAVRSAVHGGLGVGVTVRSFVDLEVLDAVLRVVGIQAPELNIPVTRLQRDDWFLLPDQQHALGYLTARLS